MEDVDGEQNEWKTLQGQVGCDLTLLNIILPEIFPAGSDAEAGPAALLPAGGPEGPNDGAEETQAEDGLAELCSQSDKHRGQTLKQLY